VDKITAWKWQKNADICILKILLCTLYLEPEMVPSPASYMELQNGSI